MSKQTGGNPADDSAFEDFVAAAAQTESVAELAFLSASQARLDRISKTSERKSRQQLAKAYAIFCIASAKGTLADLAAAIKATEPTIKSQNPSTIILKGFFDYGDEGAYFVTRDKAVVEYAKSRDVPLDGLEQFIRICGGLHKAYELSRATRKGVETSSPKQKRVHGTPPSDFELDGDEVLARLRLSNAEKGTIEFVDCVHLYRRESEGARQEFIADVRVLLDGAILRALGKRNGDYRPDAAADFTLLNKSLDANAASNV